MTSHRNGSSRQAGHSQRRTPSGSRKRSPTTYSESLLRRLQNTSLKATDYLRPTSWLWTIHRKRNAQNRDLKVIITSRDSQTGTGKTTLALWLAVHFDHHGFDADKVTVHPGEFKKLYNERRAGEVIIMDEAEQLDSRRSMSNKNVEFWNLWQTMRFRQITSILTLPTRSALDKRGMELADVWIQVTSRGHARVHQIIVDDYSGQVKPKLMEHLDFPDASYMDVKAAADQKKEQLVEGEEFDEQEGEVLDPEKIRKETRDEVLKGLYKSAEVTHKELAEGAGLSRRQVTRILGDS
jgi:hypothetical protein